VGIYHALLHFEEIEHKASVLETKVGARTRAGSRKQTGKIQALEDSGLIALVNVKV
jgi:hypothetical protein